MNSVKYPVSAIERLSCEIFEKLGFSKEDAAQIVDVLLLADLYGIRSHGTQRLIRYHKAIGRESVRVNAKPEIVFETPVSAVIDGHSGMGQLIATYAMKLAIEKAKKVGMAFVTVRNSNHYGIAGYYSKMACDEGLIGMSMTNSESIMVHTNSKQALLGSNPIAFAMPASPHPFWFDAATTVVPKGKLEVYRKADKPLMEGWGVDENGEVCTDAERVLACIDNKKGVGGILPLGGAGEESGGHKGYGYSMMCELLTSIVSGGATANHHVRKAGEGAGTCHGFLVMDPAIFGDAEAMKANLSVFLEELRAAKRADEEVRIYTHGEKEFEMYEKTLAEGMDVDISTISEMLRICSDLGIDGNAYLGDVDVSGAKASIYDNATRPM